MQYCHESNASELIGLFLYAGLLPFHYNKKSLVEKGNTPWLVIPS